MDCFQFKPVPFAFCSSIFCTSTFDIAFGAGAAVANRPPGWPGTVVRVLVPIVGLPVVAFGFVLVADGLRGIRPAVPDVPVEAGLSSS